jgi:hypothetical protein
MRSKQKADDDYSTPSHRLVSFGRKTPEMFYLEFFDPDRGHETFTLILPPRELRRLASLLTTMAQQLEGTP